MCIRDRSVSMSCMAVVVYHRPSHPYTAGTEHVGFHRPDRHCLHQARSAVRCSASRMVSCILLRNKRVRHEISYYYPDVGSSIAQTRAKIIRSPKRIGDKNAYVQQMHRVVTPRMMLWSCPEGYHSREKNRLPVPSARGTTLFTTT